MAAASKSETFFAATIFQCATGGLMAGEFISTNDRLASRIGVLDSGRSSDS